MIDKPVNSFLLISYSNRLLILLIYRFFGPFSTTVVAATSMAYCHVLCDLFVHTNYAVIYPYVLDVSYPLIHFFPLYSLNHTFEELKNAAI